MSILSMVQNIAADAGFQAPSYVVGNNDEIAVQLLSQINRETVRLSNEFFWQKLVQNYVFNFLNGQNSYALPSDFNFILPNTIWNQSGRQPIICPLTPEDYQLQLNYLVTSAYYKMVYVYGNLMYVTPVPSGYQTEILGNNAFSTNAAAPNTIEVTVASGSLYKIGQQVTISGATAFGTLTAAQINLIATPITNIVGNIISYTTTGTAGTATGGGTAASVGAGDVVVYQYCSINYYQNALGGFQSSILSDSDTTRVPEYIVELGAKLRFLVAKGLVTSEEMENSYEKKDYDFQIKRQMMIDGIGQKTIHCQTGGTAYWLAAYTQDSNWPQV
jgi:hypothetical protein